MYKSFRHGGKIGDVIYSLPTIRELGGGILYLPERTPDACNNLYSSLKELLLLQPYIHEVREYPSGLAYNEQAPGIHIDYDLDRARLQPLKGVIHIVKRYMDAFGVEYMAWKEPWLVLPDDHVCKGWSLLDNDYVLINYTGRHIRNDKMNIESKVDWSAIRHSIPETKYFIGTPDEHELFVNKFGPVRYKPTENILELALMIRDAKAIYCNQSSTLALAQSLGKTYYLEPKPMKQNCLLYTPNENILQ